MCGTYLKNRSIKNQLCSVQVFSKKRKCHSDQKCRFPWISWSSPVVPDSIGTRLPGPSPYHWLDDIPSQTTRVVSPSSHRSGCGSTCGWEAGIVSMVVPEDILTPINAAFPVGGWTNPFDKYIVQIGSSSPRIGVKTKKHLSCHQRPTRLIFWNTHVQKGAWWNDHCPFCSLFYLYISDSVDPRILGVF